MVAKIPIQNIKCVESYRANGRMDGQIDTLVIPIKGFHPLIIYDDEEEDAKDR
jgi:hypothetical protein